jgi:hypothetical protein
MDSELIQLIRIHLGRFLHQGIPSFSEAHLQRTGRQPSRGEVNCDILTHGLIGLIEYSYHQGPLGGTRYGMQAANWTYSARMTVLDVRMWPRGDIPGLGLTDGDTGTSFF